jgi:hypothetical protein
VHSVGYNIFVPHLLVEDQILDDNHIVRTPRKILFISCDHLFISCGLQELNRRVLALEQSSVALGAEKEKAEAALEEVRISSSFALQMF